MTKQEFMAMSLPYGLKVILSTENRNYKKGSIYAYSYQLAHDSYKNNKAKVDLCTPIINPLSNLTKEIEHNGEKFVPIDLLRQDGYYIGEDWIIENFKDVENSSFGFIQKLIKWHFDIANLIEKGEAIDVNSLNENPYK